MRISMFSSIITRKAITAGDWQKVYTLHFRKNTRNSNLTGTTQALLQTGVIFTWLKIPCLRWLILKLGISGTEKTKDESLTRTIGKHWLNGFRKESFWTTKTNRIPYSKPKFPFIYFRLYLKESIRQPRGPLVSLRS